MRFLILFLLSSPAFAQDFFPAGALHEKISAVAPIEGLSIGKKDDKTTWRIDFKPEATLEQRAAAQQTLQAFDATTVSAPKSETDKLNDKINTLLAILGVVGTAAIGKTAYDKLKSDTEKA